MSDSEQEQPANSVSQDDKARKQEIWSFVLALLGVVTQVMPWWPYTLVGGMILCGVGLAYVAKANGRHMGWCFFALLPFLGFSLFAAIFPLRTRSTRNIARFVIVLLVLGILAAIAIPNFMHYGARARNAEAKVNLGGIFVAAVSMKEERKTFVITDINQLGYAPSGTPLYTFWYPVNGVPTRINVVSADRAGSCDGLPTTVKVTASATGFTAAARGNIDGDDICDEWSINDARVLTNTLNDLQH